MADNYDFDDDIYHDTAFTKAVEEAERRAGVSSSTILTKSKPTATSSTSAILNHRDPVPSAAGNTQRSAVPGGAAGPGPGGSKSGVQTSAFVSPAQTGKVQQPAPQKINRPTGTSSILVSTKQVCALF